MYVVCIFAVRASRPDTLAAIVEQPAGVSDKEVLLGWLRTNGYRDEAQRHYRVSAGPVISWTPIMANHPPLE
jgi:hypothetical protein